MPLYGGRGDVHRFGGFFDGQAAEETQLDEASLLRIDGLKTLEGVVEREDVDRLLTAGDERLVERDARATPAALRLSSLQAGVVSRKASSWSGPDLSRTISVRGLSLVRIQ